MSMMTNSVQPLRLRLSFMVIWVIMCSSEVSQKNSKFFLKRTTNTTSAMNRHGPWFHSSHLQTTCQGTRGGRGQGRPGEGKGHGGLCQGFQSGLQIFQTPQAQGPSQKKRKDMFEMGYTVYISILNCKVWNCFFWLMVCNSFVESPNYQVLKH